MAVKEQKMMRKDLVDDREYLNRRMGELERDYSTFKDHHKEISEFIDPRRGRFFVEDRNQGDKRFKNIINNRATMDCRKATAGMLAGVASPSRPWFTWTTMDKELASFVPARKWMTLFQRVILLVLAKSNFYNMAPTMLRELLLFGTGCMTHVDDFDDVARFYTHTAGSYFIAQDHKLRVNTIGRKFQMTSGQMIGKFGVGKVSSTVRNQVENGNYNAWHTVNHLIELNPFRGDKEIGAEFMPFRSVYFEASCKQANDKDVFLKRSGFEGFPAYVPRWELSGEDIYAVNCPGMTNLGDVKQLQQQEREKAKAIAKSSTPPLQGPPSMRNQPITNLPGGFTANNGTLNGQKIEAIYKVDPHVQELLYDIQATEKRISEGFFVDMFMAITNMGGIQPKNELQLSQINEERLLQIGPVLEQVHGEWLDRMVRRVAQQVLKAGIMPEAPKELQGKELDLEFVSSLATAQKSVATSSIERTIGFAGALGEAGFDVTAKIDADAALDEYAELVGAPVRIVVPNEEANAKRQEAAQRVAQQEQMQMAQQAASIMQTASSAKLDDGNALSAVMGGG